MGFVIQKNYERGDRCRVSWAIDKTSPKTSDFSEVLQWAGSLTYATWDMIGLRDL